MDCLLEVSDRVDWARDMLVHGIAAAKDNALHNARRYLERVLCLQPTCEQEVEAL